MSKSYSCVAFLALAFLCVCVRESLADDFLQRGEPAFVREKGAALLHAPDFSELAKELSPTVVNIAGETEEDSPEETARGSSPRGEETPSRSLGSGVVVHPDGFIVTNNHVVEKSDKVIVRMLDDKSEYEAQIIGRDVKTDLALLKIAPNDRLPYALLGNSDELKVGEWVMAIGNQFQLGHTVSAGIVSAVSRRVPSPSAGPYDAYIQTDASINPGSSGGPLFNTRGQVVGITTAIFSPARAQFGGSGFNIGIAFAIPARVVETVIKQLKQHGRVTRGLLGVIIQPIDADIAQAVGLKHPDGALVADVMEKSPAEEAGFRRKDVIIAFDGHTIKEYDDLPLLVANTKIGSAVAIQIIRNGKTETLSATITELDESPVDDKSAKEIKPNSIGLVLRPLDESARLSLKRKDIQGVLVTLVEPGSEAARAGLEKGDVISEINGEQTTSPESAERLIAGLDHTKPALLLVLKPEGSRFLVLKFKNRNGTK